MSVTIEAGVLSRAMKSAASVVERTNTIPILANVRLEVFGNQLEIVTSNLEIEYRQRVALVGAGDLATTCDANRLAAIASAAEPGAQITLELAAAGRLTAKAARSRWQLPVLPVDDFPAMKPPADTASSISTDGGPLAIAIGRTAWSAETNTTRYYLCGVFAHGEDGRMRLVATDGHTIASLHTAISWPAGASDMIIPTKFVRLIERMVADVEHIDLSWDERLLQVTAGDVTIIGKLVDGTFPDYKRVIPETGDTPVLVDPESLRKALRRMELVGSDKTRSIAMDIQAGALELQMTDGGGGGEANEHVPADCEAMHRVGFNCGYLASALEAIGGDTVEIHQRSASELAVIRRSVSDGALCGVMPMRV
ncbi:DNA polymerase-3 subunit beta [Novosphingobium fluoreni]|uniref:Beta sliding clamp n=1 Tax=Novosphingobium fluoreni TaxID=1391222 RepID=A0A7W6C990_9SPHN|nr:DNA polymerase III subunit beta [Novosphingobium fluoreni]MBB3940722.1 DNA polymerase-3 subunit beta [Novosphingobium fluoreni]